MTPAAAGDQQVHREGNIRVYYHTSGEHAVEPADTNRNGIPDQVEDVATQTVAARILFVEVLGFPDPFQTERFRAASFLDIHLRHRDTLRMNGAAYDELQRFNREGDPKGTLSLCFNVATSVKASLNPTPAHEYFHLIQYGVTYFKNRWFTEGTARWSERGLEAGALGPAGTLPSWPLREEEAAGVFTMAYDASGHFWNPLAARLDRRGGIPEAPALARLQAMTYADGSPVLKDLELTGWEFVREVLHELGRWDDTAFRELGYERWSEANQMSPKNNPYILRAVREVVERLESKR